MIIAGWGAFRCQIPHVTKMKLLLAIVSNTTTFVTQLLEDQTWIQLVIGNVLLNSKIKLNDANIVISRMSNKLISGSRKYTFQVLKTRNVDNKRICTMSN